MPDHPTVDMTNLKARQQAVWNSGQYDRMAEALAPGTEAFVARLDLAPASKVLDLACGTGEAAILLAKAGHKVTGADFALRSVEMARDKALEQRLPIHFDAADAEQLPYADGCFDAVISLIGAMFAPQPERAAAEMLRVCRPGGQIVMGNWAREGFIADFFAIVARYAPPPRGIPSPLDWGDASIVHARLGKGASQLTCTLRTHRFEFPFGPREVVDCFRTHFGPTLQAFKKLVPEAQAQLAADLQRHWSDRNLATDGRTVVEAELLEVRAVCRAGR